MPLNITPRAALLQKSKLPLASGREAIAYYKIVFSLRYFYTFLSNTTH
ncbi:MAG: hypothetical protein ACYTXC_06980 [Nostoc sp.]